VISQKLIDGLGRVGLDPEALCKLLQGGDN